MVAGAWRSAVAVTFRPNPLGIRLRVADAHDLIARVRHGTLDASALVDSVPNRLALQLAGLKRGGTIAVAARLGRFLEGKPSGAVALIVTAVCR
jgi:hypothetical protein